MAVNERMRILCEQLREYLSTRRVAPEERKEPEDWTCQGHSVYENPRYIHFENGCPADYLWAKEFDEGRGEKDGE